MTEANQLCPSHEDEASDPLLEGHPSQSVVLKDGREAVVHSFADYEEACLSVYVTIGPDSVAEAKFDPFRGYFRGVEVQAAYRRLGIASAMYSYIEQAGYQVSPSNNVQPDGERFWAGRKKSMLANTTVANQNFDPKSNFGPKPNL